MNDKKILEQAEKTITAYHLCDSCLGRLFRQIQKETTNQQKGEIIRKKLKQTKKIKAKDCWLCEGLTEEIGHFVDLISDALQEFEFNTFLIGSKIDEDIVEREKELQGFIDSEDFEPIKMEINREVGKLLEKKLNKIVDFVSPDITALVDTSFDIVSLQICSLFIYGRYKKLKRGIPQTKWPCRICRGKGCKSCNYTGKMYDTSVEELVSKKPMDLINGSDESFHGCGREDVDALMLGNGRPFVLEIKNPKKRTIDISHLESEINSYVKDKIEINNLRLSDKKEIARIKNAEFNKIYRIVIEGEKIIKKEKLKEVAQILQGKTIKQLTPTRVAHRRANKVRERKIYKCELESVEGSIARLTIETQSGTYIKELVSGDDGRTTPNISEMLGTPCKVNELDVIEIKGE